MSTWHALVGKISDHFRRQIVPHGRGLTGPLVNTQITTRKLCAAKPKRQVMELCVDMTHASHPSNPPSHVRFVLQILFAKFSLQVLLLAGDDVVLYACNNSGQQN